MNFEDLLTDLPENTTPDDTVNTDATEQEGEVCK